MLTNSIPGPINARASNSGEATPRNLDEAISNAMHQADVDLAERVRPIVSGISYSHYGQPDWLFHVRMPGEPTSPNYPDFTHDHVSIVARAWSPNVYNSAEWAEGVASLAVPHSATETEVLMGIFLIITELENHERLEHFKYKGEHFMAPHDAGGKFQLPFEKMLPSAEWLAVNPSYAAQ